MRRVAGIALLLALFAARAAAQDDAYLDATARDLVARARAARGAQGAEINSYTATITQRWSARLRLPLRDRLLYHEEAAVRARWTRDGLAVIQRLGSRAVSAGEPAEPGDLPDVDGLFDPTSDRIMFGIDFGDLLSGGAQRDSADAMRGDSMRADSSRADSSRVSVSIGSGGVDAKVEVEDDEIENFWIAHPLADGSERYYRYRSGDTLTLRLPDGRAVRSVELNVIPRVASFHHLRASLWIEPETGSLVRAIFRPARELDVQRDTAFIEPGSVDDLDWIPGMFRPIVVDLELMTVEYSLWDEGGHWLPRRMHMEAYIRAGVIRLPFEGEVAYRIEEVDDARVAEPMTPEEVLASWGVEPGSLVVDTVKAESGGIGLVVQPADPQVLVQSDELPPPIWEDAIGFMTEAELEQFAARLDREVPMSSLGIRPTYDLQWLFQGRGLVRYNRIEALSLGVRGVVDHPLARGHATLRLGAADLHPNLELGALVPRRRFALRLDGYHHLTTVEPGLAAFESSEPALGFGNSLNAFLFGRDDGLYYRASGATLALEPRPEDAQWWRLALFAEHQDAVRRKVEWNVASWLDDDRLFAPNLRADEVNVAGASLVVAPWFGIGSGPQAGIELFGEAAGWDSTFARARVTGRTILPLFGSLRLGLEAAAGHAWGGTPIQYDWFPGGVETLRGYDVGVMAGESMARARAELTSGGQSIALALFSDAGWAGRREDFDTDDALLSAGAGITIMDGLLRFDVVRALVAPTGWRVHLHLNALL